MQSTETGRPLAGRHIVVTRPPGQAEELALRLEALGARVTTLPVIQIEPVDDTRPMDAAIRQLGAYDWIVLTSATGVHVLADRLAALGLDWDTRRRARIAVIGPATANALQARGVMPDAMPDEYVAEHLSETLGNVAGQRVLLLRADIARKDLADDLRLRGAQVDDVTAYRTVSALVDASTLSALLGHDRPDAITFTSSSTVRGLVESLLERGYDTNEALIGIALVAIGPITAATLRAHGLEPAAVAEVYTAAGLTSAVVTYFSQIVLPREGV